MSPVWSKCGFVFILWCAPIWWSCDGDQDTDPTNGDSDTDSSNESDSDTDSSDDSDSDTDSDEDTDTETGNVCEQNDLDDEWEEGSGGGQIVAEFCGSGPWESSAQDPCITFEFVKLWFPDDSDGLACYAYGDFYHLQISQTFTDGELMDHPHLGMSVETEHKQTGVHETFSFFNARIYYPLVPDPQEEQDVVKLALSPGACTMTIDEDWFGGTIECQELIDAQSGEQYTLNAHWTCCDVI